MKSLFLLINISSLLLHLSCSDNSTGPIKTDTLSDGEGNVYKTVKIGGQWWMAENLKVKLFRNSDSIPIVKKSAIWQGLNTPALCYYNNKSSNAEIYGLLYNWFAVNDERDIAPAGWHIATDDDWKTLEEYLGINVDDSNIIGWRGNDEGGKLKARGTTFWSSPNNGATDRFGFNALPAGQRYVAGVFEELGQAGYWWTASRFSEASSWLRILRYNRSDINRFDDYKQYGFSVRCVRD